MLPPGLCSKLPPGLGMDYDGDGQSTRESGSGSIDYTIDSSSSDTSNGYESGPVTDKLEPLYVHGSSFPDPKAVDPLVHPYLRELSDLHSKYGTTFPDPMQSSLVDTDPSICDYSQVLHEFDRRTQLIAQRLSQLTQRPA
jgi:hypothetical protein